MADFGYLKSCADIYRNDLVNNIMPFWLKNGIDPVNGGVYTCLDRQGNLIDTTKSVWFQGRFGFVAAYAYNSIERNPEWLAASKSCIDFIEAHCFDPEDGRMYFEVMADGTPLRKRRYVFSECFAAIAMSEYSIASGDRSYAEKALKLFKDIRRFLATPELTPAKYLPAQPAIGHSITMIPINTASYRRVYRTAETLHASGIQVPARDCDTRRRPDRYMQRTYNQPRTLHRDRMVPACRSPAPRMGCRHNKDGHNHT